MDEIRRALLGDRSAQERLTERGVLLPCPGCKGETARPHSMMMCIEIRCPCGFVSTGWDLEEARKVWNTRAPILSEEEMEMLNECSV